MIVEIKGVKSREWVLFPISRFLRGKIAELGPEDDLYTVRTVVFKDDDQFVYSARHPGRHGEPTALIEVQFYHAGHFFSRDDKEDSAKRLTLVKAITQAFSDQLIIVAFAPPWQEWGINVPVVSVSA